MRIYFTKSSPIVITVLIVILILGLMATSVSAYNSVNAPARNCNCDCDCSTMNMQSSLPACCSMPDCSLLDCSLPYVPDDGSILPNCSSLNWNIQDGQLVLSVPIGSNNSSEQFGEQELPQFSPPCLFSDYHCRNSLSSEDPYLN